MRSLRFLPAILLLLLAFPAPLRAAPLEMDTTRLSAGDPALDRQTVQFSGEAVGEALNAGRDYRWVNLLDEGIAIGVYTTAKSVAAIDGYGDYDRTGAVVEVVGVYNVACDQHGGDLDVHATSVRVIKGSVARDHPVRSSKALAALVALGLAAWLIRRYWMITRLRQ